MTRFEFEVYSYRQKHLLFCANTGTSLFMGFMGLQVQIVLTHPPLGKVVFLPYAQVT